MLGGGRKCGLASGASTGVWISPLVVVVVVEVVDVTLVKDATDALCEVDESVRWLWADDVDVDDVSAGMAMVECAVAPEAMDTCGFVAIVSSCVLSV